MTRSPASPVTRSPTSPANPANPTSPANPANPTNPANPANPTNPTGPAGPATAADLRTSPFLAACRGQPHDRTPVWFMRQAGRSLPEYRAVRGVGSILEAIRQPDLATEVTLQPIRRYGVDAAILYSDIVVPVAAIGFGVDIRPGVGPVVEQPFTDAADLGRLRPLEPDLDLPYVQETVRALVGELRVPLIGFAGAPFTVASYLVEGRPSRDYARTKALMLGDPALFGRLLDRLADLALASLRAQVAAGAAAVQLFDSWAGALTPQHYRRHVAPHTAKVLGGLADLDVPRIHFGVGTGELLSLMGEVGADVVGVDWRVPLDVARARVGARRALQGNLDPAVCLAPWPAVEEAALDVLRRNGGHPGHVFNLGHGVLPATDPATLERLVALVHEPPADRLAPHGSPPAAPRPTRSAPGVAQRSPAPEVVPGSPASEPSPPAHP